MMRTGMGMGDEDGDGDGDRESSPSPAADRHSQAERGDMGQGTQDPGSLPGLAICVGSSAPRAVPRQ